MNEQILYEQRENENESKHSYGKEVLKCYLILIWTETCKNRELHIQIIPATHNCHI